MSDDSQRPIVFKRVKKTFHGGHHGGAWKIAYADFVTAMMAFFLLMWLLTSVNKAKLEGISSYFKTPMRVALTGGGSGTKSSMLPNKGDGILMKPGTRPEQGKGDKPDQGDGDKAGQGESDLKVIADAIQVRVEKRRLEELKEQIEQAILVVPALAKFKELIRIELTTDGLRLQILDDRNRPSFDLGSGRMKDHTSAVLRQLAVLLNQVPNRISVSGHTDSKAYAGGLGGYSNWELSADRANSARRELVNGGIEEGKILRVVGLGSAVPFDKDNPANPMNRRITIMVLNKKAAEIVSSDGGTLDVLRPTEQVPTQLAPPEAPLAAERR
ncbi:MAG: flagellar motor protein MotB [Rhodocyclaceae bacterium]|nr:flagellar motor protein MotB [Rhodocyclaceae bacterium]